MIAAVAALACGPAWAAPSPAPADFSASDARLKACLARHGDTPGVDTCYGVAWHAADRGLNATYAGLADALKHPTTGDEARDAEILRA